MLGLKASQGHEKYLTEALCRNRRDIFYSSYNIPKHLACLFSSKPNYTDTKDTNWLGLCKVEQGKLDNFNTKDKWEG